MDIWEILAANTTSGDAWTRMNELLTVLPGKHVYQDNIVTGQIQNVIVSVPYTQSVVPTEVATISITPITQLVISTEQSTWQLST